MNTPYVTTKDPIANYNYCRSGIKLLLLAFLTKTLNCFTAAI